MSAVTDRWSAEQVLALAPDASGAAAGRKLASTAPWSDTGATASAVWGLCKGSGSTPYQTVVDLAGPAYRCSCPSRKFPCKHALGLLLLWSGQQVPDSDAPAEFAEGWLAGRAERSSTAAASTPADKVKEPADPAAAARRAEQRASRIAAGVDELSRWLRDQARTGLAGADRAGYSRTDPVAARLVDAQAPALAAAVRRLAAVAVSGQAWPSRLLEEHALLHLLTEAHSRLATLPDPLAATVRSRIGYPVRTEDVLAQPPVRDVWNVLALRERGEDRLTTRRVTLHGTRTGRIALVLSFAPPGQPLDGSLVPGTCVAADLHFYPAGVPLRAVVGARHSDPSPLAGLPGDTVIRAHRRWADALAQDPWLTELPVILADVTPAPSASAPSGWVLTDRTDDHGAALPVVDSAGVWTLLAVAGAEPATVVADYTPAGVSLSAVATDTGLVML